MSMMVIERVHLFIKYDVAMWRHRWTERFWMMLAWHCLPYKLRYWIVIRAFADAMGSDQHPDELQFHEVMKKMR